MMPMHHFYYHIDYQLIMKAISIFLKYLAFLSFNLYNQKILFFLLRKGKCMDNYKIAKNVSILTIIINLLLGVFKVIAGIAGCSAAMVADGFHTASDVVTSIFVIIGIRISSKEADDKHPYGHEKFEPAFGKLISLFLALTGIMIGYEGIKVLLSGEFSSPGTIALIAAVLSIIVKEGMYWYTRYYAKKIKSVSMEADAWHHRSDAFSSIGTFIGILGAKLGFSFLDPLTAVIVSVLIIQVGIKLYLTSLDQLVDTAAATEVIDQIKSLTYSVSGVLSIDDLKTRVFGNKLYIDLEIGVDPLVTVEQGHDIATNVHDLIEHTLVDVKHCMVHIQPHLAA